MNVDLLRYIKGILRWWWLLLLSTALAAVTSFYVSSQQPHIYQTSTTLLVGQVTQKITPTFQDFALSQQLAESYAQIATRQPVLQATIDALGLSTDWQSLKWQIYVASLPRTQLLAVNVSDTSPERAVAIADEIAYQLILQSPTSPENETRRREEALLRPA
jgi:capsular polysaccharide biosynthesis protein